MEKSHVSFLTKVNHAGGHDQGRIFEFTLVDSELTRVDSIPFTSINVKKF